MSETTQQPEPGAGAVRKRGRPPKAMGTNGGGKPKRIRRTKAQIEAANVAARVMQTAAIAASPAAESVPLVMQKVKNREISVQATAVAGLDSLTPTERYRTALWLQHYCGEIVVQGA